MASSNQTSRFQLCQWAENDPVLREDFNADNQKTEAAVVSALNLVEYNKTVTGQYTGSYTGANSRVQSISLGFQPRMVFVMNRGGGGETYTGYSSLAMPNLDAECVKITGSGFTVEGPLNYSPTTGGTTGASNPFRYFAYR